jgi:hypothetical protein
MTYDIAAHIQTPNIAGNFFAAQDDAIKRRAALQQEAGQNRLRELLPQVINANTPGAQNNALAQVAGIDPNAMGPLQQHFASLNEAQKQEMAQANDQIVRTLAGIQAIPDPQAKHQAWLQAKQQATAMGGVTAQWVSQLPDDPESGIQMAFSHVAPIDALLKQSGYGQKDDTRYQQALGPDGQIIGGYDPRTNTISPIGRGGQPRQSRPLLNPQNMQTSIPIPPDEQAAFLAAARANDAGQPASFDAVNGQAVPSQNAPQGPQAPAAPMAAPMQPQAPTGTQPKYYGHAPPAPHENAAQAKIDALRKLGASDADIRASMLGGQQGGNVTAPGDPTQTGDAYLATLPVGMRGVVKAIANGDQAPPSSSSRSPQAQALLQAVYQYDPTTNSTNLPARTQTRKDFTSGKSAQNLRALNQAIGHLGLLDSQIGGTAGHNFQTLNRVENAFARETGDPGITNYEQTASALAGELTQVFRGNSGAEADLNRNLAQLSAAQSTEQKQAAMENITGLLNSRIEELGQQYSQGMGRTVDPFTLLNPHAAAVMAKIHGGKPSQNVANAPDQQHPNVGWTVTRIK